MHTHPVWRRLFYNLAFFVFHGLFTSAAGDHCLVLAQAGMVPGGSPLGQVAGTSSKISKRKSSHAPLSRLEELQKEIFSTALPCGNGKHPQERKKNRYFLQNHKTGAIF
jgi:hypothetical protein